MLYRILGHSRDNGQRMTLEVEAQSKADAEKQAKRQNLQVIRIEPATASLEPATEKEWTSLKPRRSFRMPWLLLFLVAAGAAIYYFWPMINSLIPHAAPR